MAEHADIRTWLANIVTDNGDEDLAELLGELERVKAMVLARLLANVRSSLPREVPTDRLLTAQEVSDRTHLSLDWLYKNKARLPFCRRVGRKVLFSEAGLTKWLATRTP